MMINLPIQPLITDATPDDLRKDFVATYFMLRRGLTLLSVAFPVVLLAYSFYAFGTLQWDSISAFYGAAGDGWVRNYFVATLCAVGSLLVMYRGFGSLENWLLKFAGIFAVLIAFVPCHCWNRLTPSNKWHGTFAFAFFGCMVAVCELCARTTITLLPAEKQDSYRRRYHAIGVSLIVAPLLALAVAYSTELPASLNFAKLPPRATFVIEWIGVWIFAAYWATKTCEFRITSAEERVVKGELRKSKGFGLVPADVPDEKLEPKSQYEANLLRAKLGR
jgi:hypothetical protein